MATVDKTRLSDGCVTLEGGVDSGKAPNLIAKNQCYSAVNTTFRGGWAQPRPGWRKHELKFASGEDRTAFSEAIFQTAGGYTADNGTGSLISMQGGKVFRVSLSNMAVQDISIPSDLNPANITQAWNVQAENYFIIQDGISKPFIFSGGSSSRAGIDQIPVGKQITYYMGRLWVAFGSEYVGGDIIYGDRGRQDILYFTEVKYLNEGGSFSVPSNFGKITAFKPIANINTALGQGELIVFTQSGVFAMLVPQDRAQWKNTTQPLQRVIQLSDGAASQDAVVNVNEDLFYRRATNGIASLAYAVRNAGQWGNHSISGEVQDILDSYSREFLQYGSGVNFDNRMLMTATPATVQGRGVVHKGLVVLDFDLITGMRETLPPAWEGYWTGLRIFKVVTVIHQNVTRCFFYTLNKDNQIEIWEQTFNEQFDYNGIEDVRIEWSQEDRSMDFGTKFEAKKLASGDLFFDRVSGFLEFNIDFRPDGHPCYIPWDSWTEYAEVNQCGPFDRCATIQEYKEQYRPKRQLVQPQDDFDPILQKQFRVGYEFQTRRRIKGFCRVKQQRLNAHSVQEPPSGGQIGAVNNCTPLTCSECATNYSSESDQPELPPT